MRFSSFLQFILGFILGIVLLALGAAGVAVLLFGRLASAPPEPVFSTTSQSSSPVTASPNNGSTPAEPSSRQSDEAAQVAPEQDRAEAQEEDESDELEPGAYKARVTWPQGLSIRDRPSLEAERIGGLDFETEVIILRDSDDNQWQQIRLPDSGQEGWVKAGNIQKIEE